MRKIRVSPWITRIETVFEPEKPRITVETYRRGLEYLRKCSKEERENCPIYSKVRGEIREYRLIQRRIPESYKALYLEKRGVRLAMNVCEHYRNAAFFNDTTHRIRDAITRKRASMRISNRGSGVRTEKGYWLGRYKRIKKDRIGEDKIPKNMDRHIGVEIEFISPTDADALEDAFIAAGLENHVTVKTDGSVKDTYVECNGDCRYGDNCECCNCCRCGELSCDANNGEECDDANNCECSCDCECDCTGREGHEVTVIGTETEIGKIIKRVCKVLADNDAAVNKTCGLHIHIDSRTRARSDVYEKLVYALPALSRVVPKSRLKNNYCILNEIGRSQCDRYYAINSQSFQSKKTIEVRLHSGTTDPKKINHWITLLLAVVKADLPDTPQPRTIGQLNEYVRIPVRTYRWMLQRQRLFNSEFKEESQTERIAA